MIDFTSLVKDGSTAPSGENCQPWRFVVTNNILSVFNIPERDMSLYNVQQQGSYIAHGALIENIKMSASCQGYEVSVSLFPNKNDITHVADLSFKEKGVEKDVLYRFLSLRCTNRKSYQHKKLSDVEKTVLMSEIVKESNCSLFFTEEKDAVVSLSKAAAVNERIVFENKNIHDFFYSHLLWNKKEEETRGGFFVDTLEFTPPQRVLVRLFNNWKIVSFLNKVLGVSKVISHDNAKRYASSSGFIAIVSQDSSKESYVQAGMLMQRVWLRATSLDLAVHPCNGTIYFFDQITRGDKKAFTEQQCILIEKSYRDIINAFSLQQGQNMCFMLRIGYAHPPSAVAGRVFPSVDYRV
jgi:hypothetical protein